MPHAYALIHEEDGIYGVSVPDFPGCITTARSVDDAVRKVSEALTFHVAGMVEDNDPLPADRNLAYLKKDADFADASHEAAVAAVSYERPGQSKQIDIFVEESLLEAVDSAAAAVGQDRSAYLAGAAQERIRRSLQA